MKPKPIYRMCGCEIVFEVMEYSLYHGRNLVATFSTRNAAIRYLAREFVIPIQH